MARGGAAAILWGPLDDRGRRPQVAETTLTLPICEFPAEAEAAACTLAIQLCRQHAGQAPVHIAGDRRDLVQYSAGVGRIRQPVVALPLEAALQGFALEGRSVSWGLLPRSANREADALARWAAHAGS